MVGVSILKGFCKGEREREWIYREKGIFEYFCTCLYIVVNDPVDWGKDIQVILTLLFWKSIELVGALLHCSSI